MESELNWDCISPNTALEPGSVDVIIAKLYAVNPSLAYEWVRKYGNPPMDTAESLSSIPRLTSYWTKVLINNGELEAGKHLHADMSHDEWLDSFNFHVVPFLQRSHQVHL